MEKKEIIKHINESINEIGFDFLGINSLHEEEEKYEIMVGYDFQKEFLYDLFFNPSKIKIDTSEAIINKETEKNLNRGIFSLKYETTINYEQNNENYEFDIMFSGENVNFLIKPSDVDGRKTMIIDWDSIDYEIYTKMGDLITFHIFEKIKDEKIERNFIKHFIGYFIEREVLV